MVEQLIAAPRPLTEQDNAREFDCGEPTLNQWLRERALKARSTRDAVTYVATADNGVIVGYYSLAMTSIMREDVGIGRFTRNSPNPIPCVLLARLAIDNRVQGQGLGADLLSDAIDRAAIAADIVGARLLIVDALNESARSFYLHHEFVPLLERNRLAHRL